MSLAEGIDWQLECGQIRQRGAFLLSTELWSDCSFLLGPEEIPVKAHKLILAMASPVFQAMFYGPIAEGSAPIPIPDIQSDIFRKVLQYVYTDDIELDNYVIAFELYYAAHKYMLPHLQTVCTTYLSGTLIPENACRIYEFAELIGDKELVTESLEMIKAETKRALADSSFEELAIDTVTKILSMEGISISSELVLFDAAERYYLAYQKGLNNKSLNTLLADISPENDTMSKTNNTTMEKNEDAITHSAEASNNEIVIENRNEERNNTTNSTENDTHKCEENDIKEVEVVNTNKITSFILPMVLNFNYDSGDDDNTQNLSDSKENGIEEVANTEKAEGGIENNDNLSNHGQQNASESQCNENSQKQEDKEIEKQDPTVLKLIKPIRFLTLSVKELAEYKPKSSLLTQHDILALMMNIASTETYMPLPSGFSTCREQRFLTLRANELAEPKSSLLSEGDKKALIINIAFPHSVVRHRPVPMSNVASRHVESRDKDTRDNTAALCHRFVSN